MKMALKGAGLFFVAAGVFAAAGLGRAPAAQPSASPSTSIDAANLQETGEIDPRYG
ncbi:MAG: hypothetical protein HKP01_02295, partial [Gemmatimonadetes bacterium]|nr:hypothetical protein [Gemmatimonadota bacterium]